MVFVVCLCGNSIVVVGNGDHTGYFFGYRPHILKDNVRMANLADGKEPRPCRAFGHERLVAPRLKNILLQCHNVSRHICLGPD